jgi:uncharacterized integral membrane protein
MKRLLSFLLGMLSFVVLAAFALANRRWVTVSFDPILPDDPWLAIEVPLWAVLFAGIFIGLVAGGVATWLRQGRWRRRARRAERERDLLREDRERLLKEKERLQASAAEGGAAPASLPGPAAR